MGAEAIKINDWKRIVFGEAPPVFFLEIVLRTVVVYAILMIAFRLMGNRMAGQLNRIEQASLVTLAAAIGVPIQSPERGLLPSVVIALVVVVCGRLIAGKSSRSETFERKSQGKADLLVKNGTICISAIKKTTISRERLFAQLRSMKIIHLGQVQRFYLEANGSFTLVRQKESRPGLAVLPGYDKEFLSRLNRADVLVCSSCGNSERQGSFCKQCNSLSAEQAITETEL
jgi:uncharacterized membrane protein YcaP (DUF421 family)